MFDIGNVITLFSGRILYINHMIKSNFNESHNSNGIQKYPKKKEESCIVDLPFRMKILKQMILPFIIL